MIKRHLLDKGLIALSPKGLWSGSVAELIAAAWTMATAHRHRAALLRQPAASPQPPAEAAPNIPVPTRPAGTVFPYGGFPIANGFRLTSPARSLGTVAQTPPTSCLWGLRRAAVPERDCFCNIEIGVLASHIIASRRAIRSAETWFESKLRAFRTAIEAELLRQSVIADCCYIYT